MRLRIADQDAARLGCEPELEFSIVDITTKDLFELVDRYGFEAEDWPTPLLGEVAFEDAGNPDAPRRSPRWQRSVFAWMALHQNGHDVSWDDVDSLAYFRIKLVAGDETEPGKDNPEPEASTTPPSETSSD